MPGRNSVECHQRLPILVDSIDSSGFWTISSDLFVILTSSSILLMYFQHTSYIFPKWCDHKKISKSKSSLCVDFCIVRPSWSGSPIPNAMKDHWCRCNKCNGGKLVVKSTWYSHNPKGVRQGQSIHPRGSPSPRRSPFPDTEPGPMDIDIIEPPGDLDPLGKVSQATLSDFVGIACLSYQFSLPCFI